MSLFALKFYISTKNFRGVLTLILKSSGLNVEFRNVKIIGFSKIQIDNLKVKDLAGNVVIDAKKTTAGISLLMPTRLNRIDVYKDHNPNTQSFPLLYLLILLKTNQNYLFLPCNNTNLLL